MAKPRGPLGGTVALKGKTCHYSAVQDDGNKHNMYEVWFQAIARDRLLKLDFNTN
jgi:hypothetical protein